MTSMFTGIKRKMSRFVLKVVAEERRANADGDGCREDAVMASAPVAGRCANAVVQDREGADATVPGLASGVARSGHVFISYKSEEKEKADAIKAYVEKLGYPCWMAPDSLHRRGTQDYGDDIHRAIRECRCLLFVLSPRALGSWWIRKEVQYAMADCRKPVIPFLIAPIPDAKREEDSLFIDIRLEKQILNEEGARNGTMDLSVLDRYLASAFVESPMSAVSPTGGQFAPSAGSEPTASTAVAASREDWSRWRSLASFHLERIRELNAVDPLNVEPTDLSPEARREELRLSSTEAALNLMRILASSDPPSEPGSSFDPGAVRGEASRDLARLVYEEGDRFEPAVHDMAAPFAAAELPWAAFVAQSRHYSPDGKTELKESNQTKARALLEIAVRDPANPYAAFLLGNCWMFGIGGDVSGSRAWHWYQEAERTGCADAWFRISQLFYWGTFGIRKNLAKAEEFARKGAAAGVARCHVLLGDILRDAARAESETPDYSAAEVEYAKAYEGGYRQALSAIFDLCFIYAWTPTLPAFKDPDRLLQRASRAGLGGAFDSFVDRTFWGVGETEANAEAAIDYALAGVRQNSAYCGGRLGELLVQRASDEEAGDLDVGVITAFAESNSELLGNPETRRFLAVFSRKVFPPGLHEDFGKTDLPLSPFWTALLEKGELPSHIADESRFAPFHFLEFLRDFRAKPGGELFRVQRLWRAFRLLDDIRCAGEVRERGLTEVFPEDSLRLDGSRLDEACAVLESVPQAFPPLADELAQKIRRIEDLLRREGGRNGSLTEEDVCREAADFEMTLRRDATQNNRLLHVARILSDLERRLSHPFLAASLRLFRNGYLQKSGDLDGTKFGVLFFVLNARYRDPLKNGGVLFAARDALWKVFHQGNIQAFFPFLELCLFGCRIGDDVIPPDFDSIERIEPVLRELVETEMAQTVDSGNREVCIQVAFAMALIFLDRELVTASGKENWGRASLYSIPNGMEWLSIVLELGVRKRWEDICPELVQFARKRAEELKNRGFVVVQKAMQDESLDRLAENELRVVRRDRQQTCIAELAEQVTNSDLEAMGFQNVNLEDSTLDFVASSDDIAVLFAVIPPETDYTVSNGDNLPDDVPKRTLDCIGPHNTVLPCLFDLLAKSREKLHKLVETAEIRLAILASMKTINAMRALWKDAIRESGVKLVPHEFFLTYLETVFPTKNENADGVAAEKPEAENPPPPGTP